MSRITCPSQVDKQPLNKSNEQKCAFFVVVWFYNILPTPHHPTLERNNQRGLICAVRIEIPDSKRMLLFGIISILERFTSEEKKTV